MENLLAGRYYGKQKDVPKAIPYGLLPVTHVAVTNVEQVNELEEKPSPPCTASTSDVESSSDSSSDWEYVKAGEDQNNNDVCRAADLRGQPTEGHQSRMNVNGQTIRAGGKLNEGGPSTLGVSASSPADRNNSGKSIVYLTVYVDDIMVAGTAGDINRFVQDIAKHFNLKNLGRVRHLLAWK